MRSLVLAAMLGGVLFGSDTGLRVSVYATAGAVREHLTTTDGRAAAAAKMHRLSVTRVVLEGRRGDEYVDPETLRSVRDHLAKLGLQSSGGIATVPGKTFGVRQQGALTWLNWEADTPQKHVAGFFRENAAVFDELVVDDFYCTDGHVAGIRKGACRA